jgi:exosortase
MSAARRLLSRNALFAGFIVASAIAFWAPLESVADLILHTTEYGYIGLIPVVVLGLFFVERRNVFHRVHYSLGAGTILLAAGIALGASAAKSFPLSGVETRLCLEILGLVIVWIGAFVFCYGTEAAHAGAFSLLFMLLFIPLPHSLLAQPIAFVQHGSAAVTSLLFAVSGVPVFHTGLTFVLSKLTFVVATECSGIHSTTALFIVSLLIGHFCPELRWKRIILVAVVLPIICFTNGLRMFILALLAVYVDMDFFRGNLHRRGGVIFFALALVILVVITRLLLLYQGRKHPSVAAINPKSKI